MVGFCTSAEFVEHLTGESHPERPDRIRAIALAVRQAGLIDSANPFPEFSPGFRIHPVGGEKLVELTPRMAEEASVRLVHSQRHIETIRRICEGGGGVVDSGDTVVSARSFELGLLSCGAVLTCADAVMEGKVKRAFSAGRPPGHHAEPDRSMGFCLFANVAIAAKYLQKKHGVHHLAIVDFDVHHGNGTQAALEDDPSVLFVSIHQHPATCYPGTGYEWEVGEGAGRGTILNVPMKPGSGDEEYIAAFEAKIISKLDHFKPEAILISAGFDAHSDDPLAQMEVSDDGFAVMTRMLVDVANVNCGGRVISALEGGYHLGALGRSVVRHLVELRK